MNPRRSADYTRRQLLAAGGLAALASCGCWGRAFGQQGIPASYHPCKSPDPKPEQQAESRALSVRPDIANVEHNSRGRMPNGVLAAPSSNAHAALRVPVSKVASLLPPTIDPKKISVQQLAALHTPQLYRDRLALSRAKFWKTGLEITLGFVNNPSQFMLDVIQTATRMWNENISPTKLTVTSNDPRSCHIAVGFQGDGHWSLVGTDSVSASMRQEKGGRSLNVEPTSDRESMVGVALHELGHALGAIHEHQNPNAIIPWNVPVVYQYYETTQGWSDQEILWNVLGKTTYEAIEATIFDPKSIMLYPIAAGLLDHSKPDWQSFVSDWNFVLSEKDKSFIRLNYPGDKPSDPIKPTENPQSLTARPLTIGQSIDGEFKSYGQIDLYKFDVTDAGKYVIETIEDPAIHVVLAFANSDGTPKGEGWHLSTVGPRTLNAREVHDLTAGSYYIRASHRNRPGMGKYTLRVSKK